MLIYEVICPECGGNRNLLQSTCYLCGSKQNISEFERVLADYEASSRHFEASFSREFATAREAR